MTPVKDYQFCWYLNSMMDLDFRINNDIEIQLTKQKRIFLCMNFAGPTDRYLIYLQNNLTENIYYLNLNILIFG
jgi:hypothetical protein